MKHLKFLGHAKASAALSKDPSTKVGAVALDDDFDVVSTGYNGFARGVNDDPERYADREFKYRLIVHAEANLVAQAARNGRSLKGCTVILTSLFPCSACASLLVQAGVKCIIAPVVDNERWAEEAKYARLIFSEAGVEVIDYQGEVNA